MGVGTMKMVAATKVEVGGTNPDTRVSNGSGAVQICINLVQAMALMNHG